MKSPIINFLWLVFGGLVIAVIYFIVGLLMCVTIVGIPFGLQLFKLGSYVLWPFGHELVNGPGEPGCISVVMNLLWILLDGGRLRWCMCSAGRFSALPSLAFPGA